MRLIAALVIWLLVPLVAVAQDADEVPDVVAPAGVEWEDIADRAEIIVTSEAPSLFALTRIRDTLYEWRDRFAAARGENAGRIATVEDQIAALGEATDDEAEVVTARRAALNEKLEDLRAPSLLAEEAFAEANGLITEVDDRIRERDTEQLSKRQPSPLTPTYLAEGVAAFRDGLSSLWQEVKGGFQAARVSGRLSSQLPAVLALLAGALVMLARGRQWVMSAQATAEAVAAKPTPIRSFMLSLLEIFLPGLGLVALYLALAQLDILGSGVGEIAGSIVSAGFIILLTKWLANRFFPQGPFGGPLSYDAAARADMRRYGVWLGWGVALIVVIDTLLLLGEPSAPAFSAFKLPLDLVLAFVLYKMGVRLRTAPEAEGEDDASVGRSRNFVGLLCIVVAILAPLLAIAGYRAASDALFRPAVITLAFLGVLILLQRLVNDGWVSWSDTDSEAPLAPVLISFVLLILSLPVVAFIWGARATELLEIWTRVREGFRIGETSISPTDLLLFVLVFAIGYLLTQFIKGTLRTSVMPRTKLDLGGQNAIVAGVGYVGVFLAAIAAIVAAGIDLSNIALVAGALSVGIGFGLQNIVSNFVSGIILLIERPVSEGDWIEVNGQMGYVKDISVRSTRIETFDRSDVIIPNADLISGQVTNWTRGNSIGRVIVPVGVAYGSDVEKVKNILDSVARDHPMVVLDPEPVVLFQEFGDSSLNFEIRAILRDINFIMGVKSEMNTEIAKRFAEEGIEIPFPQRDVWMRTTEETAE